MVGRQSPFDRSGKKLLKNYFFDWLLVSLGLFLIVLVFVQKWGWLEREPASYLTTFETIAQETETTVFVDIAGAVISPGLYQLPANSRVNDLISACGGVSSWASRSFLEKNLNRARLLQDGEKIYIPYQGQGEQLSGEVVDYQDLIGRVNINQAGLQELMSLPGIGEKYAQAIIDYRQSVGPFSSLEEIKEVKGIGEKTFADIESKIEI